MTFEMDTMRAPIPSGDTPTVTNNGAFKCSNIVYLRSFPLDLEEAPTVSAPQPAPITRTRRDSDDTSQAYESFVLLLLEFSER